jgi:peptidoglycan/xylan/chitin deacetylase (PgdA/CDA1 family)
MVACTNQPRMQIKNSIEANHEAKSLLEWNSSEYNPATIFQKMREQLKDHPDTGDEVCKELLNLSGKDLSLFENEINSSENEMLLKSCKPMLKQHLEDYWQEQRKSLDAMGLNFTFPVRVEKRDLSKGYRAQTGDVAPKELILTFDDGPSPENTVQILDILKGVGARVMFFHLGPHVQSNPNIVYREAIDGHKIGSHSLTHRCLANNPICTKANNGKALTTDEAITEIRGGHQAVYDAIGFVDPFFRFPYGESDPALSGYLASKQVGQFYWNIDSEDWRAQANDKLLQNVLAQIDKAQRGIVLFHDVQRRTLEILPSFLRAIYDRGYTLVVLEPMDEQARYNSLLVTKRSPTP